MTTSAPDKAASQRSDVFISYSRKDREFVKRLEAELQSRGREAWVDWEGIRPAEEFMQAIFPAIEGTDTFIFVLSPDSVTSEICGKELAHALSHNKRMIPIMARDVEAKAVPEPLAKLNWVFARDADSFEAAADFLISALDTDLGWVRAHTRLLTRALEWEGKAKSNSFVLRGEDLRAAEQWLAQAGTEKERQPTALQTEYIIASRKAAARRQRITLGAVTFGLVVALVLAALAFYQRNLAEERRRLARARELATEARLEVSSPEDGLQRSTLLAIESLNSAWTLDGYIACVNAMRRLPHRPSIRATEERRVIALAFSPDGRWLASEDKNARVVIWDTHAQKQITPEMPEVGMVSAALAFSPDSRWLASPSEPAALIWETATWKLVKELLRPENETGGNRQTNSVAFSPDGRLLATAAHYSPGVDVYATVAWEKDAGWAKATKAEPGSKGARVAAFSPHGKWLATGSGGVTIWDTATKKKLAQFEQMDPWSLAFSADSRTLAVGEENGRLHLLKFPENFEPAGRKYISLESGGGVVAFSPRGNYFASADGDGARVWNLPQGGEPAGSSQPKLAMELPFPASTIVFSPEGTAVITASVDGTITTWPLPLAGGAVAEVIPHTAAVEVISHAAAVTAVTFSRNGDFLVTASDVLRVFKADTGGWSEVAARKIPEPVSTVGFTPDGRWLVALFGKAVHLFSPETWNESLPALDHAKTVTGISFSPDGKLVATRTFREDRRGQPDSPSNSHIWDLAARRLVASVTRPDYNDYRLPGNPAFAAPETAGDPKLAAAADSWEALRLGQSAPRSRNEPWSVTESRSSDGRWLADGGLLSEVQSGRQVALTDHQESVTDAVFSPNADWYVTASKDKSVRFWPLRAANLRAEATARLGRNLTYEESRKFFPDEPYPRTCAALPIHPTVREKARELATAGDVGGATALFRQILKAEPASPFDPAAEARKLAEEGRRARESAQGNSKPSQGQTP